MMAVAPAVHPDDNADESAPATIAATADFQPALDPLLPEESPRSARSHRATISLGHSGHDDRDIIVLDDDTPQRPAPPASRPRRPEYRQLFSSLRNK